LKIVAKDIKWDTDGEKLDLPDKVALDVDDAQVAEYDTIDEYLDEHLADLVSDKIGWCVKSVDYEVVAYSMTMTNEAKRNEEAAVEPLVRLSVSLTKSESNVFFTMLAMSTTEQTDIDFATLMSIEQKFCKARKTNDK
jgi:hypothetical protein